MSAARREIARSMIARRMARRTKSPRLSARSGMSLVEAMVAVMVLTIAVYMMSATITTSLVHTQVKREQAMAVEMARNQLEILRGASFDDLFALYNHVPEDDPGGRGTAPGPYFAIPGLDPGPDDRDGFVGEIVLPAARAVLREDAKVEDLGLPRDLDGDFVIDSADHAEDYLVLPVVVRVEWKGRAGVRQFQMYTMLARLVKFGGV